MKTRLERGKRMKKKGFTLIELLAVIVILAIIALIAVPIVMNIISKANKSAFKDSAYGILKAGESYYTSELLENSEGITEDLIFTFPNNIEELEFQGSKPIGGTMTVRKDGKISLAIHNGKHCVTKGFEDEDIQISDDISNCAPISPNSLTALATNTIKKQVVSTSLQADGTVATTTTEENETVEVPACITNKTKCESGTAVFINVNSNETYKFYVLNDDITKNEVTLIMDRNLGDTISWMSSYYSNDKGPLTALTALKQRTSGWTNIPAYTYTLENDADGLGGSNTYAPISKFATATATTTATATATTTEGIPESVVENVRARLPRREEIYAIDNSTGLTNTPWLKENVDGHSGKIYGYWTSTTVSWASSLVYCVGYGGGQNIRIDLTDASMSDGSHYGLRPVITLSK